jgi:cell division protein FtsA
MREQPNPHFVGLDVGTDSVRCVVGMLAQGESRPSIIGHGSAQNYGMRKGSIAHVDDTTEAIVQAITEAERVSGVRIEQATVNCNGVNVSGMNSKGVIAISTANREITADDRARVEEAATVVKLPTNREIIQVFTRNYSVDGQPNIKDPVGMHGVRLEADTHIITCATPNLRNINMALEKSQVAPTRHTVSSLGAAEAVLTRQQKEAGTVLVDIGAGTTNIAVIEDGEIQHIAVLPIGGTYLTNDLAIGLKTDLDIAEQVKVKFASLLPEAKKKSSVRLKHEEQELHFEGSEIYDISEARIEELFEYVDKELKRIQRSRKLPGGVVLSGGTAKLPGVAEFAKQQLQLPARLAVLQPVGGLVDSVQDPAWFTAVGLMLLDMLLPPEHGTDTEHPGAFDSVSGLVSNIKGYLKLR